MRFREEQDSMGTVRIPEGAYYGPQTQRAVENFAISGLGMPAALIRAIGMIKKHAARVNGDLGLLKHDVAAAIMQAAGEVMSGRFDDQFVVDVFQTGSGTSTHMNANEVIAGRANEILTGKRGGKSPVHPNDHVNRGQSSNDVVPTAIHIAAATEIRQALLPSAEGLCKALAEKAREFEGVWKIGRTHLQDAVPLTLGQEFGGYARQVALGIARVMRAESALSELALGGTAVGTGMNTHPDFASRVIAGIAEETGLPFVEAVNHFEAQSSRDAAVEASGALKTLAVSLVKIANDIRWLASGPRCGLSEIEIPPLQPGSSIMPGKINPVIPEMVVQVAAQVIGNDAAITFSGQAGNFELNAMLPVIAHHLIQSVLLLGRAMHALDEKCVRGITANLDRCASTLEHSLALVTALVPALGYDRAADLAEEAYRTGRTIRQVARAGGLLPAEEVDRILDRAMGGERKK